MSVIAVAAALVVVGVAGATGSNITPESQWANSGTQVTWTGNWSGTAPFTVTFNYGDPDNTGPSGHTTIGPTSATSDTTDFKYTYYTCTATTYTQTMTVTDHLGLQSTSQSQVNVRAGQFC